MLSPRSLATGTLLLIACTSPPAADAPGDVAMFRGGPRHLGTYPATLGPELVGAQWRVETDGGVDGSATIRNDTVWIGASDGLLRALDLVTGDRDWETQLGAPIVATPALGDGMVYVTTRDGRLHALDADDGTLRWSASGDAALPMPWGHESGDRYTPSPAVSGGLVLWAGADGVVRASDRTTGELRWQTATGGPIWSSPAVADGVVYVGSTDGNLYALDLTSGERHWAFRTEGAGLASADYGFDRRTIQGSPAVRDGLVFVGARDGFLYAIHANDGSLAWRVDHKISWVIGSPAVDDSLVYVGSSDAQFFQALDAMTGAERWRVMLHGLVWSSPAVSGDLIVVGDAQGHVHGIDRLTGAIRWTFETAGGIFSSPVPAGRLLVVGSLDGGIYALCTGADAPTRLVVADEVPSHVALAERLASRGYQRLAPKALGRWLADSAPDARDITIVMATFQLPDDVASLPWAKSPLRRFLDAGGKVVWTTMPPLVWPFDSTGKPVGLDGLRWDAPTALLGVPHDKAIFDRRRVTTTAAGEHWGLRGHWMTGWGVAPSRVTAVLGLDSWGLAGAWVRSYGGPAGTGFVMLYGGDPEQIYQAAEHRPACDS